jgi:hypothetical protein
MTSQGSASGRFTRAIKQRNLFQAEIAAREMRGLSLADALELVVLIAAQRPDRLQRAAIRWHGRLEVIGRRRSSAGIDRVAIPTGDLPTALPNASLARLGEAKTS